jgi:hypothetical protein
MEGPGKQYPYEPFLPGLLLWKLDIGSLFPLLVRKYPI